MKTINTLLLATALGAGILYAADTTSVGGAAGLGTGNGNIGSSINGAGAGSINQGLPGNGSVNAGGSSSLSADQNASRSGVSLNGAVNGNASASMTMPQHQEVRDVITTVQTKRQQYEDQQKQLLVELKTASNEQRTFIRERIKNNRQAFQADTEQLRQELLDAAKQLKKDAHTDVDDMIDSAK